MFPILGIGDLKIRWKRRRRERHKTNMSDQQNSNSARALRFFVHFVHRYCSPATRNFLVSRFTEDVKHKATIFFFFYWTQIQSFRSNFRKISQHLTNWMKWDKEVWNSAIQVSFSLPLLSREPIKLKEKAKRSSLYQRLYLQGIPCT